MIAETQPQPQEVRKKRGRPRKKPFEEGNGDTAPAKPTAGTKGKRKAQDGDDSDDEPPPKKSKRKAKDKDEGDEEEPPKAKVKAKKPAVAASEGWKAADGKPKVGRKPSTSSAAAAAAVDEDDGESVPTPSKKKRKIKLFPSSQPVSFDWNQLGQVRVGVACGQIPATHVRRPAERGRARHPDKVVACQGDGKRPPEVCLWRENKFGVWELWQSRGSPLSWAYVVWGVFFGFGLRIYNVSRLARTAATQELGCRYVGQNG